MTILGLFGSEVFGAGFFGVVQENIPIAGTTTNSTIEAALAQVTENVQQIGNVVTVGGIDVTELVESISIKNHERQVTANCNLVVIGDTPVSVVEGAAVSVTAIFRFEDGTTFTNDIFSGIVRTVQPSSGSKNSSVSISAYDDAEEALSATPTNTTWTGTNTALVESELSAAGFIAQDLDFTEFTMGATGLTGFSTVRDLIIAAAGAVDEVVVFFQSSGVICVKSVSAFRDSGFSIPKTGYTYLQETNSRNDKYKTVTVQGITGLTGSATGTGTTDYSETSSFITLAADCETKADAVVVRSEATKRTTQIPLNPLVRVGDTVTITGSDDTEKTCRVTGISHFIQWTAPNSSPGAWSTVSLEDAA